MESCLHFHSMIWIFYKNSSLVLSTLDAKLNLLSHILQWNIVFSFIQSYLPAWIFNNNLSQIHVSNWIFCHISSNGILLALSFKAKNSCLVFKSKRQIGSLSHISNNWIFVCSSILYTLQNGQKYLTSCQTESLVAYLIMEPWVLFHSKLWMFDQNSSLVLKSGCLIESFVSCLTIEFS